MSRYDLVVIGGGTAGIVAAITAAGVGARVVLIERARTGGDCLWTGCVPSKALLAAAQRAHDMRTADRVGIGGGAPEVDLASVMDHVRSAQRAIAPHDSPQRLREEGVEVRHGTARFTGEDRLAVDGRTVAFRRALVATGSTPVVPPVDGLAAAGPLTSDTVWGLEELPRRLLIVGGGPIGCELGQAFGRLGSRVTIVEMAGGLLPVADAVAGRTVARTLRAEGADVRTSSELVRVRPDGGDAGWRAAVEGPGGRDEVAADVILVAAGRAAATGGLGLDRAGVRTREDGAVAVDDGLRTSNPRIYAAGDVAMRLPFTHVAAAEGAAVAANALFGLRRTVPTGEIPWVVFTDPEVAQVGLTEQQARRCGEGAETRIVEHHDLDRAVTEARTSGFSKVVADGRGRIVGATVVGPRAGEVVAEVTAWLRAGGTLSDLGRSIHAYPTYAEGPHRAGVAHLRDRFLTARVRAVARPVLWAARQVDRLRG